MELSFTQGRWNYDRWGGFDSISSCNAKPPGLFCASINFVESSTTYSAPELAFQSALGSLRYAGLSSLLERPSIYRSFYHSQRLHLTMSTDHSDGSRSGINLEQTVTVVLQPNEQKAGPEDFRRNVGFELSVTPKRVHAEMETSSSILYEYPIKEYMETEQFDLGLTWKHPIAWSSPHAPLYASRFSMGSGNERGAIAISLKSIQGLVAINNVIERCKLQANVLQIVPWYVKVYYHTLQLVVDERPQALTDFVERMRVSPSEDKVSPGVMEMVLQFPCEMKSAVLSIVFDKGFLHIDEYPPDVNQGFDIPSAIISFPDFHAGLKRVLFSLTQNFYLYPCPLMTSDFSMPYNVITITCTVFALYFGSLLNVLERGGKTFEKQRCKQSSVPSPSAI
ncbi:GPI transamidase component PIG-T [Glycine soja]|uniref:GPI transamidase component PIG-T n=1 Tax=Glycine soja TaxID=3848 RepID=A0A445I742_GLYSO|nr:GPI transamidase component PIG-T [Glycine soja]